MEHRDPTQEPDPMSVVAGPQAEAAVTPPEPTGGTPGWLSAGQRTLLRAILNRLLPARDGLPGAGDLGVDGAIERGLAGAPAVRRLLLDGLVEVEVVSGRSTARDFEALAAEGQDALLRRVEAERPAFFAALVEHAYRGYYTDPRVHAAIGYESRPPQPLGYELPPFDPDLLVRQREREPFWRRTS